MSWFGDIIGAIASPIVAPATALGNLVGDTVNGRGNTLSDLGSLIASPVVGPVNAYGKVVKDLGPSAPNLQSPSALSTTPTQGQAADTAAAQNITNEEVAAAAGTVPSTAAMLQDRESYKSTSTLLGA